MAMAHADAVGMPSFSLPTTTGSEYRFDQVPKKLQLVVCFLGTECPLAQLYGPRLVKLAADFQNRGVVFVGVDSNVQDSMDELRTYTEKYEISFPMVKDYDQSVAEFFHATRTPEVVVVDAQGTVQYQGRIDDQYQPGLSRSSAKQHDLRDAISAVLERRPILNSRTEAVGCLIGRSRALAEHGEITYCNQVSRILNAQCVECHRDAEIGPFALTDYDEVVGWADMMLEVIEQGRMPPWHANPKFGHFKNTRHMPQQAKDQLAQWVASGMPYGNAANLPKPAELAEKYPHLQHTAGLNEVPDAEFSMHDSPFHVPPEGTVEYQYFVVDPGFTEDQWVRSAKVIPGNRSVVHHAIVFIRPPDGAKFRGVSWLSAYVPGQQTRSYPTGLARRIPAGSKLVFQMHYTPNGTDAEDITKVVMSFADRKDVTHEVFTEVAIDQEFEIPPGATNHQVSMSLRHLPPKSRLLGIAPHMHLRGKSFRLTSHRGTKQNVLLDVPQYDFNWQHSYVFAEPLKLDDWDSLDCVVAFDNSSQNPANPDPSQHVMWGDQTWDEMAIAFFEIAQPLEKAMVSEGPSQHQSDPVAEQAREARIQAFVDQFFDRHDANHDGQIVRSETSLAFKRYGFAHFDKNNNGALDRDEIVSAADARL